VLRTVQEVAKHRGWKLWAVHVRTNHVHIVVTAVEAPEKVMADFKAWASRRLREAFGEPADRDRWTQHGSTRWVDTEDSLGAAITYVVEEQGEAMACFDGRDERESLPSSSDEPEA
jgi:REP element-mobilizing transposase RayT